MPDPARCFIGPIYTLQTISGEVNKFRYCFFSHFVVGGEAQSGGSVLTDVDLDFNSTAGTIENAIIDAALSKAAELNVPLVRGDVVLTRITRSLSSMMRTDNFTTTGTGVVVDAANIPVKSYSVQVTSVGLAASSWDVRLEGSLDGIKYTQILQHTTASGDGAVVYSGASMAPSTFFRSRVAGLLLGTATSINVSIIGVE